MGEIVLAGCISAHPPVIHGLTGSHIPRFDLVLLAKDSAEDADNDGYDRRNITRRRVIVYIWLYMRRKSIAIR
jgi:hypothetical protein